MITVPASNPPLKQPSSVGQRCAGILKKFPQRKLNLHETLNGVTTALGENGELRPVVMYMLTRDRQRLVARL